MCVRCCTKLGRIHAKQGWHRLPRASLTDQRCTARTKQRIGDEDERVDRLEAGASSRRRTWLSDRFRGPFSSHLLGTLCICRLLTKRAPPGGADEREKDGDWRLGRNPLRTLVKTSTTLTSQLLRSSKAGATATPLRQSWEGTLGGNASSAFVLLVHVCCCGLQHAGDMLKSLVGFSTEPGP